MAADEKRVALVIGNGAYKIGRPLANSVNDAAFVAAALGRLGFDPVIHRKNLSLIEMGRALADFAVCADHADMAIIYFAGHGMEMNGENYLLPIDADLEHVRRLPHEAKKLSEAIDTVDSVKQLGLIILDACRDNPYRGHMRGLENVRSLGGGLAAVETRGNTLVAYAAKHGTQAKDGPDGGNSPYVQALKEYLETPDLDVRLMFGRVRDKVLGLTDQTQEPHIYGSLGGKEIYLNESASHSATPPHATPSRASIHHTEPKSRPPEVNGPDSSRRRQAAAAIAAIVLILVAAGYTLWPTPKSSEAPPPNSTTIKRPTAEELAQAEDDKAYAAAQSEGTKAALEDYLKNYNRHAVEARALLRALDTAAYKAAERVNTIEAYTQYRGDWRDGQYFARAAQRIAELEKTARDLEAERLARLRAEQRAKVLEEEKQNREEGLRRTSPPPAAQITPSSGQSYWNHNESLVRLVAEGNRRRFYYEVPRSGMMAVGAKRGTLLFDGQRNGGTYVGTAHIFTSRCGAIPYHVQGVVSEDERHITMSGEAPNQINESCQVISYRHDVLVFDFVRVE